MQPTRTSWQDRQCPWRARVPIWSCSEWGLPCQCCCQRLRCALTTPFHPYHCENGGLFSVALSLGLPPLDVIQHSDPVEPGLSSRCLLQQPAAIQLSDLSQFIATQISRRQASQVTDGLIILARHLIYEDVSCKASRFISTSSHASSLSARCCFCASTSSASFW